MSSPTTRMAYTTLYEILDRALEDPKGIRIRLADYDAAVNMRMRFHQARKIDRDDNMRVYPSEDHRHGTSPYDAFQLRIRTDADGDVWLYIEPRTSDIIGDIEYLSNNEDTASWQLNSPPRLISHSGTEPLEKKSESESTVPTDDFSSKPSTMLEEQPKTTGLRRL